MAPTLKRMPAAMGMLTPLLRPTYRDGVLPVSWKIPVADQRVRSPGFCIKVLGTASSPLLAVVKTEINLSMASRSDCHMARAALWALRAFFAARFAVKSENQLMR